MFEKFHCADSVCKSLTSCVTKMFHLCCPLFTVPADSQLMAMQLLMCFYMDVYLLVNHFYIIGFCVFSGLYVLHNYLPYRVLYSIFTNFHVMSAKDTLETYLQLEAYY